jgi:ubiquinone/menaquinone biosynthesis C-methylase UbiE
MKDYLTFQADLDDPKTVAAYDELPLWSAMFGLILLKHLPLSSHLEVLDVGCGTGFPLLELAQRLGSTCRVHGIDPWAPALERARFKAAIWQVQNVEFRQGDAAAMPFAEGQFDLIVSNLGINNFSDPEAVLRECRRVSKPSAKVALTANLQGHMQEFYEVFEATLFRVGHQEAIPALRKHIEHRATVEGLAALFDRNGFRISAVRQETGTMRFLDGSSLLRHHFIKLGFLDGWKGVLDPGEQELVFDRLKAELNLLAGARGGLTLRIPMAYVEADRIS